MNELALFSGAGGGILGGTLLGWRTVAAVEIEDYPRAVLLQRQLDGILPRFPIWDDVRTFDGKPWRGRVDVISGGFPCQDISAAGKGAGITGERSGLWSEFSRIIGEVRPQFVFVENSPMLVSRGLDTVLGDLASIGFNAEWDVIGARQAGAPHKRDRIWILAYAPECIERPGRRKQQSEGGEGSGHVADTEKIRWRERHEERRGTREGTSPTGKWRGPTDGGGSWWDIDPADMADTCSAGSRDYRRAHGQGREASEAWGEGIQSEDREAYPDNDRSSGSDDADLPDTEDERVLLGKRSGADGKRSGGSWPDRRDDQTEHEGRERWPTKSRVGRVAHELADPMVITRTAFGGTVPRVARNVINRVSRLKAIGNGQVPAVAALAWHILYERLTGYEYKQGGLKW